jgi:pilus assembly protein CpaE
MATILVIDDDKNTRRVLTAILSPLGYQVITAEDGTQGLNAVQAAPPDLIITDVVMPGIDGYEVTRRLRRNARYADIPILILTGRAGLEEKLKGFEAGANDYLTKPCEGAELAARVKALFRQAERLKVVRPAEPAAAEETAVEAPAEKAEEAAPVDVARVIAVHSLRGGVGCSSLAVNLALGLTAIWDYPALLIDLVMNAGQVALFLNTPLKRTWADIATLGNDDVNGEVLISITNQHSSGLHSIAAPTYPAEGATLTGSHFNTALRLERRRYDYIVADLPHDFNDITLQALDAADIILMMVAPELASVRAAAAALETYSKLNYPPEKIRLVLNNSFEKGGIARKQIEAALHIPVDLVIPFAGEKFVRAINKGQPLILHETEDPVAALLEDYAYAVSMDRQKKFPPAHPSEAWKRAVRRARKPAPRKK